MRLSLLLFLALPAAALADNKNAQPPVPAPAYMDVTSFEYRTEGENHKIVVTSTPALSRIDLPDEGYSVLYNPQTDYYQGLEHKNYTYWEFSWPDVRTSIEGSKRYEKRLQDLGNEGLTPDSADTTTTPTTNASADTTAPPVPGSTVDSDGYVWRPTIEKKKISDLDCIRWTGETESGQNMDAWCCTEPQPKAQAAIDLLRKINEPMALVPIRTIVPDAIFPAYNALVKGGVTPVLITWGDQQNKSHFRFIESKTQDGKLALFTVPKLYVKTTLVTMDGMIDSQPAPGQRQAYGSTNTWQTPSGDKRLSQPAPMGQ